MVSCGKCGSYPNIEKTVLPAAREAQKIIEKAVQGTSDNKK